MRGDRYETAPRKLKTFIEALVQDIRGYIQAHGYWAHLSTPAWLVGHGHHPPKSDIDLLITVDDLSEAQSAAFYNFLKSHHGKRPYVGGLEASVIPDREAQSPTYPMPMLTFFSEQTPEPSQRMGGNLPRSDILFMNVVIARTRGVALWGLAPEVAIGEVDWADFLTAV